MSWKKGNQKDGRHYWLTPPDLYAELNAEFNFDYDPCPYPLPPGYDGLTAEWGRSNYVNPPFGMCLKDGKKVGTLAWVRKCIEEWNKGKLVVLIFTHYKWEVVLGSALAPDVIRNMGNVRWCATEDGRPGKGAGPTSLFIFRPKTLVTDLPEPTTVESLPIKRIQLTIDF